MTDTSVVKLLADDALAGVAAPLERATTLPPLAYTSSDVYSAECRSIFQHEWICVGREEQIPEPGDYLTVDLAGQPLIVARQDDGSIRVMSAICPHRAMPVVDGPGNARQFQCPYHLWKFRLDGRLISAPLMDGAAGFPDADCGLRGVAVDRWGGFVFANLDQAAAPLAPRLAGLDTVVGAYNTGDMVALTHIDFECPWNWKVLIENFMEAYHHIGPHSESVQPTHHAKDSYVTGSVTDGWTVLHMPEVAGREQGDDLPVIDGLSARQRGETLAVLVMPTCAWLLTPSVGFWYQLTPQAHDRMQLRIHTMLPGALARSPNGAELAAGVQEVIRHIHLEDIDANVGPWRGLNAPLTQPGRLSPLEASIWQCNQWWLTRVSGELDSA